MGSQSDRSSEMMHGGAIANPIFRLLTCIVAVFVVTAVLDTVSLRDRPLFPLLIFLFLVLIVSSLWGFRYALFVSLLAALGFSWLRPPVRRFWLSDWRDIFALAAFLVIAIITSHLSDRARRDALSAKHAEDAVRVSEERLREVVETMPTMAWSARPDGSNAFANRQWVEYTGLSPEQTAGSGWQSTVHPEDLSGHLEKWRQSLATGRLFEHEARYRRAADGQYRWFLIRGMPLRDEHDEILKWYGIATDIEDRKQAEEGLRQSEERWRSVFENSAIGVVLTELNGHFLATNHVFQTIVDYTEEELRALTFLDVTYEHFREANRALIAELVEGKRRQFQIEKQYRRKDGSLIWVSNNVSLVPGTERVPQFFMALSEDITERKRAEALLTGEKRILEMVAEGDPLHQILDTVCQFVEEQASGSLASILLVDGNRLRHGGAPSLPKAYTEAIDGIVIGPTVGSCGTAAYRGEQVIVEDIATDPLWADYRELALRHSLSAAWSTPVFSSQGRVIATFAMYYREPRRPSPRDQETIEQITHLAGVAIERKLTQEALARSEHNLSLIINTIPALVWSARPDGSADFFNRHYLEFVGLSAEQAQNWGWTVAVHPDDLNSLAASWQSIMASGKAGDAEARLRRFGGEYRWFLFRANPLRDESGSIIKWFGINTDIEDRKRAEENLRRSERDLLEAQRISQTGSWKLEVLSETVTVSPQIFRIFGVKPEEGKSTPKFWLSRNHPEDQKRIQELFERSVSQKSDYDADYRIVLPDGTIKHLHAVGHPVLNESGDLVEFVGTAMDVTELKRSEEALRRSETYLAEAQKMTHTGSWAWNVRTDALFWSHEIFRIYDYGPEMTPTWDSLLERVHPEDRPEIERRKKMESTDKGWTDSEADFRIVLTDGTTKHLQSIAHPVMDSSGEITEVVGTLIDVTERKRAEEALQRSEAYLAEAQRLTHTGSWAYKAGAGGGDYFSEENFRIWGFDPQQGTPDFETLLQRIHPEDRDEVHEYRVKAVQARRDYDHEFRAVLPDGTVKHIQVLGHPVFSAGGDLIELVGTHVDVTERKRAEEERERLRQLEADLAHMNRVTMLGELASSLAHELNQPIAAAITSANACLRWLARNPPDLERARSAAIRIENDGTRAAEIIQRLRAFYKTGAPPQRELVDLNEVAGEMLALLRNEATRHSISLRTELARQLPQITADRVQLQQVLMNLMLNGIEAMTDGAGELTIRSQSTEGGGLLISVSDTGVGLPSEKQDQIFNAFYTTKPQGTGMGLAISRSIIEAHGGRLWATPNPERGATFHFTLPAESQQ